MYSSHVFAVFIASCLLEVTIQAAVPKWSPLRHALHKRLKTTYPPTTTDVHGKCLYNGQYYNPGETIQNIPCSMILCGPGGYLIYGDCTIAPYPTTTPPMPPPTTPPGCYMSGQWYPLNSEISHGADYDSHWCYSTYCDSNGQILYGDNFNCYKSTTPPTTIPTTSVLP